ncbi:MAG: peptide chain release factor N(5)-glutamine methyltransferase [Clostridiales bacterium]|nr:peptide chain release factor N(5)-glutamine methyltransferase [Clostridiales bacterium]
MRRNSWPRPADARHLRRLGIRFLKRWGIESPALEASLLLSHAAQRDRTFGFAAGRGDVLDPEAHRRYRELLRRRAQGVPLAYLLGRAEFYRFRVRVGPGVLIPRPETELLLEVALDLTKATPPSPEGGFRWGDAGTGSGILGIGLALSRPGDEVWLWDRDPRALSFAAANAWELGLARQVRLLKGGWWPAFPLRFTGVVANPPYLSLADWEKAAREVRQEPMGALVAGATGLEALEEVVKGAPPHLYPGGFLAVEIGAGQEKAVVGYLEAAGFEDVFYKRDGAGIPRVVAGRWPGG